MSDKHLVDFDEKEWFIYVSRNMSFWNNVLLFRGVYSNLPDFGIFDDGSLHISLAGVTFGGTSSHVFAFNPNCAKANEAILKSSLGRKQAEHLTEVYERYGNELLESVAVCVNSTTVETWEDFIKKYQRYTAALHITAIIGRIGADKLKERLLHLGFSEDATPEVISNVTYPDRHTPLFLSQYELYKIAFDVQVGKISVEEKEGRLTEWLRSNGHIPVNYCEEPWTMENAREQLTAILAKDATVEIKKVDEDHVRRVEKVVSELKKINDRELSELAYTVAYATYLNEYRKNIFSKTSLAYRPIFTHVAKLTGASNWRDCFFLTPEQMTDILRGKKYDVGQIKKDRAVAGLIIDEKGILREFSKEETAVFASYVKSLQGGGSAAVDANAVIKGFSASRGKVRGVVKIILSRQDFHKLNPGDVLVAMMTSVDYVPIMERASAFVTNEGGITSHASIVSREMGKPCIIGTKIATKVLKDGDMVEVDAERGVVTIIKKGND